MTFTVIAGPCCLDGEDTLQQVAEVVKEYPHTYLKGGAYKPLTWGPGHRKSYQRSLSYGGISILRIVGRKFGLSTLSECPDWCWINDGMTANRVQIGARNQQNFSLLQSINDAKLPVLLKRHFGCSLEELYASTTYLPICDVWVCERGIRAFDTYGYRFLLDYGAVSEWNRLHPTIPIFVDITHWIGVDMARTLFEADPENLFKIIRNSALISRSAGAAGILIDVHPSPPDAWVDPFACLDLNQFRRLMNELSD